MLKDFVQTPKGISVKILEYFVKILENNGQHLKGFRSKSKRILVNILTDFCKILKHFIKILKDFGLSLKEIWSKS